MRRTRSLSGMGPWRFNLSKGPSCHSKQPWGGSIQRAQSWHTWRRVPHPSEPAWSQRRAGLVDRDSPIMDRYPRHNDTAPPTIIYHQSTGVLNTVNVVFLDIEKPPPCEPVTRNPEVQNLRCFGLAATEVMLTPPTPPPWTSSSEWVIHRKGGWSQPFGSDSKWLPLRRETAATPKQEEPNIPTFNLPDTKSYHIYCCRWCWNSSKRDVFQLAMNLPIHNVRPGILRSSQKFSCEVFGSVEDGHEMQHGNHNDHFQSEITKILC